MREEGTSDDQDESQEQPRPAWDGIKRYLDHPYDLPPRDLKEFMGKGLLVTAQVIVTNDNEFTLDVQELSTSCVSVYGDMPPSEEDTDVVVDQFRMFHSALIPLSVDVRNKRRSEQCDDVDVDVTSSDDEGSDSDDSDYESSDSEESDDEGEEKEEECNEEVRTIRLLTEKMQVETRPLQRCILALGTGLHNFSELEMRQDAHEKSMALASYMAADLVIRASKPHHIGAAVACLSFKLENASETIGKNVLTSFRLTRSLKTESLAKAKQVVSEFISDTALLPQALNQNQSDNASWKYVTGEKAGTYEHMVTMSHRDANPDQLLAETSIYGNSRISRERQDWVKDFVNTKTTDTILDEVFRPSGQDVKKFAELYFSHLLAACESFKSIESKLVPETTTLTPEEWILPKLERIFVEEDVEERLLNEEASMDPIVEEEDEELADPEVDEGPSLKTMWDINRIRASLAMPLNYSSNPVIFRNS